LELFDESSCALSGGHLTTKLMEDEENGSNSLTPFFKKVTVESEATNIIGWLD